MTIEQRAREAWAIASTDGVVMHEMVAIGFVLGEDEIVWYELTNSAEPEDGRGEFFVDGEDLRSAIMVAQLDGVEGLPAVLWHTHVNTPEPSAEDIAEFPTWLADYGMVYHVPTDTVTVYNERGIISAPSMPEVAPFATCRYCDQPESAHPGGVYCPIPVTVSDGE